MPKPKALVVMDIGAFDRVFGPAERADMDSLVDLVAPPCTARGALERPAALADAEIVFSGWGGPRIDAAFLAQAPRLRAVFYSAGSVRGIVSDAFWDRGIVLTSAWGENARPVAEFAEAAIVLSLKSVWRMLADGRARQAWPARVPVAGLYGSVVGLVSLGMVGRAVARRLQSHDLTVLAYDPFATQAQVDADGLRLRLTTLPQLFAESDVVSLHTPALPETRGLIGAALLETLKPGATLINTARGAVIDQEALVALLRRRPDVTAVLDVTDPEPPPAGAAICTLPNAVLTPHIAGAMDRECRILGRCAVEECRRWLAGHPLQWQVTRERAARLA